MAQKLANETYFSMTTKQGVEEYVKQRQKHMEAGLTVKRRLSTIKTRLEHWLKYVGEDTRLKEMGRTDCENTFTTAQKNKKKVPVSRSIILYEQNSANSMMSWLHKRGETYIEVFYFKKLPKVNTGDEKKRRNTFTEEEIKVINTKLDEYIADGKKDLSLYGDLNKVITAYCFT